VGRAHSRTTTTSPRTAKGQVARVPLSRASTGRTSGEACQTRSEVRRGPDHLRGRGLPQFRTTPTGPASATSASMPRRDATHLTTTRCRRSSSTHHMTVRSRLPPVGDVSAAATDASAAPPTRVPTGQYGARCAHAHTTRTWARTPLHDVGDFSLRACTTTSRASAATRQNRPARRQRQLASLPHLQRPSTPTRCPRAAASATPSGRSLRRVRTLQGGCNLGLSPPSRASDCTRTALRRGFPAVVGCPRDDAFARARSSPASTTRLAHMLDVPQPHSCFRVNNNTTASSRSVQPLRGILAGLLVDRRGGFPSSAAQAARPATRRQRRSDDIVRSPSANAKASRPATTVLPATQYDAVSAPEAGSHGRPRREQEGQTCSSSDRFFVDRI